VVYAYNKTFPTPAISIFFSHQHSNIDLEAQQRNGPLSKYDFCILTMNMRLLLSHDTSQKTKWSYKYAWSPKDQIGCR